MPQGSISPAIGLTIPSPATDPARRRKNQRAIAAYRTCLEHHSALVVHLLPDDPRASVKHLDGLLLSGGADVHPGRYGERPHPKLGIVDVARDELEFRLTRAALRAGIPVMGICRGAQVLGVALGGGLVQDIASMVPGAVRHTTEESGPVSRHWISVASDSRLGELMRADHVRVNSLHHQSIDPLSDNIRQVAWSEDGVVEAIEPNTRQFVVGVQWHPERMWRQAPRQRRLMAAFVAAARDYAAARGCRAPLKSQ